MGELTMQVVRIYTGDDGESHFQDVDIELGTRGPAGSVSQMVDGPGVVFREVDGDYNLDFHTAPRRQFIVNLVGSVEIEIGDGTVRRLGPGTILLAEDTEGRGHISRAVNSEPRQCLVIPIDGDVPSTG